MGQQEQKSEDGSRKHEIEAGQAQSHSCHFFITLIFQINQRNVLLKGFAKLQWGGLIRFNWVMKLNQSVMQSSHFSPLYLFLSQPESGSSNYFWAGVLLTHWKVRKILRCRNSYTEAFSSYQNSKIQGGKSPEMSHWNRFCLYLSEENPFPSCATKNQTTPYSPKVRREDIWNEMSFCTTFKQKKKKKPSLFSCHSYIFVQIKQKNHYGGHLPLRNKVPKCNSKFSVNYGYQMMYLALWWTEWLILSPAS